MTAALILVAITATFVIGFLLGDRRGVKQCNQILDENQRELFKALRDDRTGFPADADDDTAQPTMH